MTIPITPVHGYRQLNATEIEAMNAGKVLEEMVLRFTDEVRATPGIDQRWLAIGVTQIQQGFMAVQRSIAQPQRIALEGDEDRA